MRVFSGVNAIARPPFAAPDFSCPSEVWLSTSKNKVATEKIANIHRMVEFLSKVKQCKQYRSARSPTGRRGF
jgi:hypothetical protein